jgi:lysophospholipase L1-like esterase
MALDLVYSHLTLAIDPFIHSGSQTHLKMFSYAILYFLMLVVAILAAIEITLRWAGKISPRRKRPQSPYLRVREGIGYEFAPYSNLTLCDERGETYNETLNGDGFRADDVELCPSQNTYRILVVGDSVAESFTVRRHHSWPVLVQNQLGTLTINGSRRKTELVNAGMGGYVSWQVRSRLCERGFALNPHLVIAVVGWNDLVLASRPDWHPRIDLSKINPNYGAEPTWAQRIVESFLSSFALTSMCKKRYDVFRARCINAKLIRSHANASGLQENAAAVAIYEQEITTITQLCSERSIKLVLIASPCLVAEDNANRPEVVNKLCNYLYHSPLSAIEFAIWYNSYMEALRRVVALTPSVHLIEADLIFRQLPPERRYEMFTDLVHLTIKGNNLLASLVVEELREVINTYPDSLKHEEEN